MPFELVDRIFPGFQHLQEPGALKSSQVLKHPADRENAGNILALMLDPVANPERQVAKLLRLVDEFVNPTARHQRLDPVLDNVLPITHAVLEVPRRVTIANAATQIEGPTDDRYARLIEAAKADIGIALVPRRYVEQELNEGRLSAPWPTFAELSERYALVSRPTPERPEALEKFESWLVGESASLVRTPACSRW